MVHVSRLDSPAGSQAFLIIPYDARRIGDLEHAPVRVYRYDVGLDELTPVWESGINPAARFVWARIRRSGTYLPVAAELEPAWGIPSTGLARAS